MWCRSGKTFSAVQALPVAALRLPPGTVATLQQLGIFQIGQLAQLPRSSLSSRFGDELLQQFDLLLGRSREVLVPYRPPPVFHADWQLDYPTTKRTALEWILEQLVQRVSRAVSSAGAKEWWNWFVACSVSPLLTVRPIGRRSQRRAQHGVLQPPQRRSSFVPVRTFITACRAVSTYCMSAITCWSCSACNSTNSTCPDLSHRCVWKPRWWRRWSAARRNYFPIGIRQATRQLACLVNRLSSRLGHQAVTRPRLVRRRAAGTRLSGPAVNRATSSPDIAAHRIPASSRHFPVDPSPVLTLRSSSRGSRRCRTGWASHTTAFP